MINAPVSQFANADSPFTELFSMLKSYEVKSEKFSTLSYSTKKLKAMYQHADNAINMLLQGLQDLGKLMSLKSKKEDVKDHSVNNIGFFISGIGNLTEALNVLRLDADYVLKERGEINY